MTNASKGMADALARSAAGTVVALSEMSADNVLAGISDETKVALAAKLSATDAPTAAAALPSNDDEDGDECSSGKPAEKCSKCGAGPKDGKPSCKCKADSSASDPAPASAANSERLRVQEVAASDAAKANPAAALAMLADDDFAGLSASAMIKLVGQAGAVTANAADPDDAARSEMRNAISETGNSDIAAGGNASTSSPALDASASWDRVMAKFAPSNH